MLKDDDIDVRRNFLKLPRDLGGLLRMSLVLRDFFIREALRGRLLDRITGGELMIAQGHVMEKRGESQLLKVESEAQSIWLAIAQAI